MRAAPGHRGRRPVRGGADAGHGGRGGRGRHHLVHRGPGGPRTSDDRRAGHPHRDPGGGRPAARRSSSARWPSATAGLFGILSEPERAERRAAGRPTRVPTTGGPVPTFGAALFLNAGSLHHVGPGRQWVELSRRWAAEGIRCLRMDIGGVGDSPLTGPPGDLSSYPPGAFDDVAAGVRYLAPDDPREVVLLGLCAGAFHSLLAAPTTGVGGVAVLNPLRLPTPGNREPGSIGDLIDGARRRPGRVADPAGPSDQIRPRRPDAAVPRVAPGQGACSTRSPGTCRTGRGGSCSCSPGGTDPVASIREVVDSGAAVCIVLGPDEWPGIGRGPDPRAPRRGPVGRVRDRLRAHPRPQLPRGERPRRRRWWCSTSGSSGPDRAGRP